MTTSGTKSLTQLKHELEAIKSNLDQMRKERAELDRRILEDGHKQAALTYQYEQLYAQELATQGTPEQTLSWQQILASDGSVSETAELKQRLSSISGFTDGVWKDTKQVALALEVVRYREGEVDRLCKVLSDILPAITPRDDGYKWIKLYPCKVFYGDCVIKVRESKDEYLIVEGVGQIDDASDYDSLQEMAQVLHDYYFTMTNEELIEDD